MNMTAPYAAPPIRLPPAIERATQILWGTACKALARFVRTFGEPAEARRLNHGDGAYFSRSIAMIRRVQKMLRYMFIVYARHFSLTAVFKPTHVRTHDASRPRARKREVAGDPATWRVGFLTPKPYRTPLIFEGRQQPPQFVLNSSHHAGMRTIARKIEGIRRVLADPMPHVRRLARLLKRERFLLPRPKPKHRPAPPYRDYWDDMHEARHQAWWALHPRNGQFNDSS